jgi:hypothetical protein
VTNKTAIEIAAMAVRITLRELKKDLTRILNVEFEWIIALLLVVVRGDVQAARCKAGGFRSRLRIAGELVPPKSYGAVTLQK